MFSVTILGSGSAGNCAVIETPQTRLLIDGGLSARQITQRLASIGVQPIELDGILLTHEHCDHMQGLQVFSRQNAVPIYCNALTAEAISHCAPADRWRFFCTGSEFTIKDVTIETFPVPHDAVDPVGFVLQHDSHALGFLTDLGFATKLALERLREVQTLVIETNHDEKLLQNDQRRPWSLKQRIMSRHGHLSNDAAGQVLEQLGSLKLRRAILGHLSRDCNSPDLALAAVRKCVGDDVEVYCAAQKDVSPRFRIDDEPAAPVELELALQ